MLFLSTLQEPYYDRLMPTATENFANMVKVGNLINHTIKNDRIDIGESSSKSKGKSSFLRRKKGETQALFQGYQPNQSWGYTLYQNHSNYQPYYSASSNQTSTVLPHYTPSNNQITPVQACLSILSNQNSSPQINYPTDNQPQNSNNPRGPRPGRTPIESIPIYYNELFPQLIQSQLIARTPFTPLILPYPR